MLQSARKHKLLQGDYHLWVVDMRDTQQYNEGHIDGASSLPFFEESLPSGEISEDGRAT